MTTKALTWALAWRGQASPSGSDEDLLYAR